MQDAKKFFRPKAFWSTLARSRHKLISRLGSPCHFAEKRKKKAGAQKAKNAAAEKLLTLSLPMEVLRRQKMGSSSREAEQRRSSTHWHFCGAFADCEITSWATTNIYESRLILNMAHTADSTRLIRSWNLKKGELKKLDLVHSCELY